MCQGHRWFHEGVREWDCDLLIEPLRRMAAMKDARLILSQAAAAYYWLANPAADPGQPSTSAAYANAIADLAVTGRTAYDTFRRGGGGAGMQESDIGVPAVRSLLIRSRLLLAAGAHADSVPDKLYSNTRDLAALMRNATGTTLWLENTGHSNEYRRGYPPPLYHLPPLEPIPWDDDDES